MYDGQHSTRYFFAALAASGPPARRENRLRIGMPGTASPDTSVKANDGVPRWTRDPGDAARRDRHRRVRGKRSDEPDDEPDTDSGTDFGAAADSTRLRRRPRRTDVSGGDPGGAVSAAAGGRRR